MGAKHELDTEESQTNKYFPHSQNIHNLNGERYKEYFFYIVPRQEKIQEL